MAVVRGTRVEETVLLPPSNIPIPDPSEITQRELRRVKEEFNAALEQRLKAQEALLVTGGVSRHEKALIKIEALDQQHQVFREDILARLGRMSEHLREFFTDKLQDVLTKVERNHELVKTVQGCDEKAMAAALSASERLDQAQRTAFEQQMTKTDASFTKEVDSLKLMINVTREASMADIRNLTGRLDRGEGGMRGHREESSDRRESQAATIGVAAQIISSVIMVVGIIGLWATLHSPPNANSLVVPTVGADTKRVDDLISVINEQNRNINARMDALSNRINLLQPGAIPPSSSYSYPTQTFPYPPQQTFPFSTPSVPNR
jgi:hypothetical protein